VETRAESSSDDDAVPNGADRFSACAICDCYIAPSTWNAGSINS